MMDERSECPLDLEHLAELSCGDTLFERDLLEEFSRSAQAHLQSLEDGLTEARAATVQRAAHSLKGAALSIGAGPVAEVCARLERAGHAGRFEGAGGDLRLLRTRLDDLLDFVSRHFGRKAA